MRQAFQVRLALAPVLALLAAATPCQAAELAAPVPEPAPAPVYRLTLTPAWTHAFVPRSVSRDALGLNVQFFFDARSRFGVGLVGALYAPFSRSEAPVVSSPLRNETRGSVLAEFAWTFLRGRRAELSLLAGVGALSTRPLSVVDPAHRTFEYGSRLAMSVGAVARVYLSPQVALSLEVRDVVYVDQQESAAIDARRPGDASTWYGDKPLTQAIETRLGLTLFLSAREPSPAAIAPR